MVKQLQYLVGTIILIMPLTVYAEATVSATGHGQVIVPQTIATIVVAVNENGKTAKEAQDKTRIKSAQLLKSLAALKTIKIETNSVTVNPNLSYDNNRTTITTYTSTYSVKIKSSIDNAGDIIDAAIKSGASIVNEPQLAANDDAIAKAQTEAIKLATIDAQNRAATALNALGLIEKSVTQITVQNSNNDRPYPVSYMMKSNDTQARSAPATQIIPGTDTVSAEVNVTLNY